MADRHGNAEPDPGARVCVTAIICAYCLSSTQSSDGLSRADDIGDWRDILQELPRRIHEWMPRLADEGVVGADAIFACLGPALEIFSRYARVERPAVNPSLWEIIWSTSGLPLLRKLLHWSSRAQMQQALKPTPA